MYYLLLICIIIIIIYYLLFIRKALSSALRSCSTGPVPNKFHWAFLLMLVWPTHNHQTNHGGGVVVEFTYQDFHAVVISETFTSYSVFYS